MVGSYSIRVYVCTCDNCGKVREVRADRSLNIINGASACRSIGWAFGKDGKTITCDKCRRFNFKDCYRYK